MDTADAEGLVRMIATSELMDAWSYGSNNNARVLALQEITRDEFGPHCALQIDGTMRRAVDLELRYNRDALTDFLRTQYTMTQEFLQERGITELISYRALAWSEAAEQPPWAVEDSLGTMVDVPQRPLAGWSPDRQMVADRLKQRWGRGVILAARHSALVGTHAPSPRG
ncbi:MULTISPECIES: hypothetical protein [unclassified Kribbella]|uniref:hypothetical protein n=1 Tax=unclassified Kribbella TaxID=2644121 RepID=UPI0033D74DA2